MGSIYDPQAEHQVEGGASLRMASCRLCGGHASGRMGTCRPNEWVCMAGLYTHAMSSRRIIDASGHVRTGMSPSRPLPRNNARNRQVYSDISLDADLPSDCPRADRSICLGMTNPAHSFKPVPHTLALRMELCPSQPWSSS